MNVHTLKTEQPYFDALLDGSKTFEVRLNDRAFQTDDYLDLREVVGVSRIQTGRSITKRITYIYSGDPRWPALAPGYVVLGICNTDFQL